MLYGGRTKPTGTWRSWSSATRWPCSAARSAPDVQSYRPSLPGRSQPDPLSAEVGSLPGAARDPAPVAPPARREEVDQAPSSSGASGSGFRGSRAGPPGGPGGPEVGLPADQGRASETRGEGLGHHHRHPAPAFWAGSGPARGPTWSEFLRSQAKGILACDFLTVETIRLKTLYVLVWIELGTKRVRLAGSTANPDSVGDQSSPEPRHGPPRRRANGEVPDSRPGFQVLQSVRRGATRRRHTHHPDPDPSPERQLGLRTMGGDREGPSAWTGRSSSA